MFIWQVKIADFGLAVLDTEEDPAHFETVKVGRTWSVVYKSDEPSATDNLNWVVWSHTTVIFTCFYCLAASVRNTRIYGT